jgi:CRISPR-associated protein Cas1
VSLRVNDAPIREQDNRDDYSWSKRNEYWLKKTPLKSRRFSRKAGVRHPLILSGHGVGLCVDHGTLSVQNGYTHFPQQRETWQFFPGDWRLPSRIVLLDVNGGITFDALSWLSIQGIPLLQINWRGEVTTVIGLTFNTADSKLAKLQLAARTNGSGLDLAKQLIMEKIENSVSTLRHVLPRSRAVDVAVEKLENNLEGIRHHPPANLGRLMGIEGRVGYAYFDAWRVVPIRWKGIDRHPIPDDWHRIEKRSSKVGNRDHPNRNASHPVNAMLNYAYAILENQVRTYVIAAGLDPTIGFLHGSYDGKHGLVYDLMEPLRPVVDQKVLEFVQKQTFTPRDFILMSNGVCRLSPQLARNVVRTINVSGNVGETVNRFVSKLRKT